MLKKFDYVKLNMDTAFGEAVSATDNKAIAIMGQKGSVQNWIGRVIFKGDSSLVLVQTNNNPTETFWISEKYLTLYNLVPSTRVEEIYVLVYKDEVLGAFHSIQDARQFAAIDCYNKQIFTSYLDDILKSFNDSLGINIPFSNYHLYRTPLIAYP